MKKVLAFACLPLYIFSQNIKYSFTNSRFNGNGYGKLTPTEYTKITVENPFVIFETFDEKLKIKKSEDTTIISIDAERFTNEGIYVNGDDMHFLYSIGSRTKNNKQLYAIPIKGTKSKIAEKTIPLLQTESLAPDVLETVVSKDKNKILFAYKLEKNKKGANKKRQAIGFFLLDFKMNILYNEELEMPYSKREMEILNYKVDSKGNIYILAKVRINNEFDFPDGGCKEYGHRLELIRVNKQNNSLEGIKINVPEISANSFGLIEDAGQNILITGCSLMSSFLVKVEFENNAVKKIGKTIADFSLDLLKANESQKVQEQIEEGFKKNKVSLDRVFYMESILNSDSSLVIIGEEFYDVVPANNGAATHHCNDIIVTKIDKNNKILWIRKIPKRQVGVRSGDYFLSPSYIQR